MKGLEKLISDNRELFDDSEPSPGHAERFRNKLAFSPRARLRKNLLYLSKVAAAAVVLISISVFLFRYSTRDLGQLISSGLAPSDLPIELQEVEKYYSLLSFQQVNSIDTLAISGEEAESVKADAMLQINELDENATELRKIYTENPNDERILAAIVNNQKMKEQVMNGIISKLNKVKK